MWQDISWCWTRFENGQVLLQHFRMLQDAARVLSTPSQHLTRSNNVARHSVEMLPAFGRASTMLPRCY